MSTDKMPPLPRPDVIDPGRFGVAWVQDSIHAYAREYAAVRVAEAEEELRRCQQDAIALQEEATRAADQCAPLLEILHKLSEAYRHHKGGPWDKARAFLAAHKEQA